MPSSSVGSGLGIRSHWVSACPNHDSSKLRDACLVKRNIELLQRLNHKPPPRFNPCVSKLQVLRSESFIATA